MYQHRARPTLVCSNWIKGVTFSTLVAGDLLTCYDVQGKFDHGKSLEADDVAEAALLPLRTTALCVPKEITLDTTQLP